MIIKQIIKLFFITLTLTQFLNANMLDKCENKTIVSQSPYITHSIDFFKMKECIVGASIYDKQVKTNLTRTGKVFVPDKKVIKKLKPNFIFTSDWTKNNVLADITPLNAKSFTLHGFQSMQQIENNLYTVGNVLNIDDFQTKVKNFSIEWKKLAHSIKSKNKKVLLMSACSVDPYSYGVKTYLGDLFTEAGFNVVDKSKKVKVFKENELEEFINKTKPDFIFGFVSYTKSNSCSVLTSSIKIPIIFLDGDNFMHPSPTLLKGLKELQEKEGEY